MKCSLCGYEFDAAKSRTGCSGCPMSRSCNKIKCPNCNFEMAPEIEFKLYGKIKEWWRKLWKN